MTNNTERARALEEAAQLCMAEASERHEKQDWADAVCCELATAIRALTTTPPEADDVWKEYRDAGHDVVGMTTSGSAYQCTRCGAAMIDLSEDLVYGEMRKCKSPADEIGSHHGNGGQVDGGEQYLIRKGAYFYRPNSQGYTPAVEQAGRYTLEEAISITHPNGPDGPRDAMSYEPAPATQQPAEREVERIESIVEAKLREIQRPDTAKVNAREIAGAIAALSPASAQQEGEPVAFMYRTPDGVMTLHFLRQYDYVTKMKATETPLYAHPPTTDQAALVEALLLARPIVESDLEQAKEHCDADWEGMSRAALDAIDTAIERAGR